METHVCTSLTVTFTYSLFLKNRSNSIMFQNIFQINSMLWAFPYIIKYFSVTWILLWILFDFVNQLYFLVWLVAFLNVLVFYYSHHYCCFLEECNLECGLRNQASVRPLMNTAKLPSRNISSLLPHSGPLLLRSWCFLVCSV